jgi:hypothetical protein
MLGYFSKGVINRYSLRRRHYSQDLKADLLAAIFPSLAVFVKPALQKLA